MNPDVILSLLHDKQQEVINLRQQVEHLKKMLEASKATDSP